MNKNRIKGRVGGGPDGNGGGAADGGGGQGEVAAAAGSATPAAAGSATTSTPEKLSGPSFAFLSLISPYVLIGFFALHSIFNTNFKGVVYIFGVMILLFISNGIFKTFGFNKQDAKTQLCTSFFGTPMFTDNSIPFGVLIYTFTFCYLLLPMIKTSSMNFPLLMTLLLILCIDIIIQKTYKCVEYIGIFVTIIIGILVGIMWSAFILYSDSELAYHVDFISDKQVCSIPSQQKFKCKVYKNGELITTMSK